MTHFTDRPCADYGLNSYRYKGRFGWVMIGARNIPEALRAAARSIDGEPEVGLLQEWTGKRYEDVVEL